MIVSWDWLGQYVDLSDLTVEEVMTRLSMTGLNCENVETVRHADGTTDVAMEVEVTSNRPDALSIVGVAREIGVLFDRPVTIPDPVISGESLGAAGSPVGQVTSLTVEAGDLCPRYILRVVRGVKVGPSPDWLVRRLTTIKSAFGKKPERPGSDDALVSEETDRPSGSGGVKPWTVNNIVDITNYVLFETGQPLHAFDLTKTAGPRIVVRKAAPGETLTAINHVDYKLDPTMAVIADAERPVALAGVMGGAESEVTEQTVDILLEAAVFDPMSIRETSRRLVLPSDSSFRFERGIDPEALDRASRRACELIVQLAGGTICEGSLVAGTMPPAAAPVTLRVDQIKRILGVAIGAGEAAAILGRLGCAIERADADAVVVTPPTWRADLTREIDLIEEVARIHGYEAIPENAPVPMAASRPRTRDRVSARVRDALTAVGFDETLTPSVVSARTDEIVSPSTDRPALTVETGMLGGNRLRRSLLPSLIEAKKHNDAHGGQATRLFEIAKVYLPQGDGLPNEPVMIGLVIGGGYAELKGTVESLVAHLAHTMVVRVAEPSTRFAGQDLFVPDRVMTLILDSPSRSRTATWQPIPLGLVGELSEAGKKRLGLRQPLAVAELHLDALEQIADLVPQFRPIQTYPVVQRDANLIVDEAVRWDRLEAAVRSTGSELLDDVAFRQIYRDEKADGPNTKRILMTMAFRATDRTLTGEEVDAAFDQVIAACRSSCDAKLMGA